MINAGKTIGIIIFAVLLATFCFSNNVFSENIQIDSPAGSYEAPGLSAGEVNVSRTNTTAIGAGEESITLQGHDAEAIEAGTPGNPASGPEQADIDLNGTPFSGKKNKYYEGISISRVNGPVNSSVVKSAKPKNMKLVTNLGKPEGVHAMAQSVKAEVKYSDSPRMNKMKDRQKKRRANMKKELEEKRKAK